jgi:hypothetical protein
MADVKSHVYINLPPSTRPPSPGTECSYSRTVEFTKSGGRNYVDPGDASRIEVEDQSIVSNPLMVLPPFFDGVKRRYS